MKNRCLVLCLLGAMLAIGLFSCDSAKDRGLLSKPENTSWTQIYANHQNHKKESLGKTFRCIQGDSTNTYSDPLSGNQFIDSLLCLPPQAIDSLYNLYCGPEADALKEQYYNALIDALAELTSPQEVDDLLLFCQNYIARGGHDPVYIEENCMGRDPLIASCIISCAAGIDIFAQPEGDHLPANAWCLEQLRQKLEVDAITDTLQEQLVAYLEAAPEADFVVILVFAGYDLYDAISTVYEYHQCLIKYRS